MSSSKRPPSPIGSVEIEKSTHTIQWSIEKFSKICPPDEVQFPMVWSRKFCAGEKSGKKLMWNVFIKGDNGGLGCFLYLRSSNWKNGAQTDADDDDELWNTKFTLVNAEVEDFEADDRKIVKCAFKFGLGNSQNNFVHSFDSGDTIQKLTAKRCAKGWNKFVSILDLYQRKKELVENDTLKITIQLTTYPDKRPILVDHLAHHLGESCLSEKFSDMKIKCGDETLDCHKVILAARSTVFCKIFESGLQEVLQGQVDIDDMSPAVVKMVLKYMYTGTVQPLTQGCGWTDLIYGAEKYDLKELKDYCFEKMFEEITNNDFGALVLAADVYNAKPEFRQMLRSHCKMHMTALMENKNFRDIFVKNVNLFYPDQK